MLLFNASRYVLALAGTAGGAGAQFLLTLVVLRLLEPAAFGRFAFLLILAQFIWAVASALFAAPFAYLGSIGDDAQGADSRATLTEVHQAFTLLGGLVAVLAAILSALPVSAALVFGAFVWVGALRSFGRISAYSNRLQSRVVCSDILYATVVVIGTVAMAIASSADVAMAFGILLAGSIIGFMPVACLALASCRSMPSAIGRYSVIWRRYASWSFIGVVVTEITANAHSYIVTLLAGPIAFGPIAASSVLVRPGTVGLNALADYERARMANLLADDAVQKLAEVTFFFRTVAVLLVVMSAIVATCVMAWAPTLLFPVAYDLGSLTIGGFLWFLILVLRAAYMPEAVLLQAKGAFKPLAWPKIWAAPVSIVGVIATVTWFDPMWSLAAIALGELVAALLIFRVASCRSRLAPFCTSFADEDLTP